MMESDTKVFKSNIIRDNNTSKNNLYDIINVIPVQPLPEKKIDINASNEFVPKCDKLYVPKKKNSRKVKTVRDIRNEFERDVYSYLPAELEKQRILLLRKIRYGTSRHEKTKEFAINLLKSYSPLSKTTWQMLLNINPEGHKFSSQYVLWNGKCIQVNGSKGGRHKFICNHDIGKFKKSSQKKPGQNSNILTRKRQLLHHALNVKFKPGPLTKKYELDVSYQKYQFGKMELVTLPKTGIEVHTSYGKPLAPVIDTFITKSFFENDGLITQQWATFAVSVLGKNQNGIIIQDQDGEDTCVTFDLNYKCFQNRILMRRDNETNQSNETTTIAASVQDDSVIFSEVTKVLEDILNAVEISLMQDDIYTGVDEPREIKSDHTLNPITHTINKNKRNGELRRLDVTVITVSETAEPAQSGLCQNDYCTFGCICDALKCSYNLKRHCGRIECMFKCTCDFSKYKYKNSFDNHTCDDIIPDLINLDKTLSQTLAKEEHKFHQTVIVTNEKSILLKSNKRNWKASKKYADFYSDMPLKTESITTQMLSIICPNLDTKNIEPWCMVHNLYKCFCKGKFVETGLIDLEENKTIDIENAASKLVKTPSDVFDIFERSNELTGKNEHINGETTPRLRRYHRISRSDKCNMIEKSKESTEKIELIDAKTKTRTRLRQDSRHDKYIKKYHGPTGLSDLLSDSSSVCARIQPYGGRKYRDEYYKLTHNKISEMEKNDEKLQKKMRNLISCDEDLPIREFLIGNEAENGPNNYNEMQCVVTDGAKRSPSDMQLVLWFEKSYKQYKQRADLGLIRLDAPKPGKLCLYAWDFILSRYRERKNYFLITKAKPFRTFIAVNIKNAFFENCINISDIALSDIDKYPIIVKNLQTKCNATDSKENFCIFRGFACCWELVGFVKKVNETHKDEKQIQHLNLREDCSQSETSYENYNLEDLPVIIDDGTYDLPTKLSNELPDSSDASFEGKSKWFVMKVKNDFTEIQFIEKGFFVKYDSIIKAIKVARVSGKTVRLSSKKFSSQQNDPQFGIYAIPIEDDCCIFIGPYEVNENLGIEAIKNMQMAHIPECRSGGIWKTCKKDDNLKLIDNPLLFMPPNFIENKELITLFSDSPVKSSTNETYVQNEAPPSTEKIKVTACKQVKPIKIPKTNGFYHLTPNGCLQPIPSPEKDLITSPLLLKTTVGSVKHSLLKKFGSPIATQDSSSEKSLFTKPIAEIAPQIKRSIEKDSTPNESKKRPEGGMFVLKPEEINKRLFEKTATNEQQPTSNFEVKDEITMDIENFLATSVICLPPPVDEVFVISDDEEENTSVGESFKNVWIVCTNIEKLGWIAGRKTSGNCISFEFPGFKSSEFYPEHEAMKKINQ